MKILPTLVLALAICQTYGHALESQLMLAKTSETVPFHDHFEKVRIVATKENPQRLRGIVWEASLTAIESSWIAGRTCSSEWSPYQAIAYIQGYSTDGPYHPHLPDC